MIALVLADCHGTVPAWPTETPDVLLFLGDNSGVERLALQRFPRVPAFGVPGNHDSPDVYKGLPVENLHGRVATLNGLTFAGLGGSLRYKQGRRFSWLFTEQEYRAILAKMRRVDVCIAHAPPVGAPGTVYVQGGLLSAISKLLQPRILYEAHEGNKALRQYVIRKRPGILLYGHLHRKDQWRIAETQIMGVFEVSTLRL
jgi:Icc-related predicted phosphoesterase